MEKNVKFTCKCGKRLVASRDKAGKKTLCPKCGEAVPIPAPAAAPDVDSEDHARPQREMEPDAEGQQPAAPEPQTAEPSEALGELRTWAKPLAGGAVAIAAWLWVKSVARKVSPGHVVGIVGVAVVVIVVLVLGFKIRADAKERRARGGVCSLKEAGDRLREGGQFAGAKEAYEAALKAIHQLDNKSHPLQEEIAAALQSPEVRYGSDPVYVLFEGKWMLWTQKAEIESKRFAEAQRAKGLVSFRGKWVKPEEKSRILREEEAKRKAEAELRQKAERVATFRRKLQKEMGRIVDRAYDEAMDQMQCDGLIGEKHRLTQRIRLLFAPSGTHDPSADAFDGAWAEKGTTITIQKIIKNKPGRTAEWLLVEANTRPVAQRGWVNVLAVWHPFMQQRFAREADISSELEDKYDEQLAKKHHMTFDELFDFCFDDKMPLDRALALLQQSQGHGRPADAEPRVERGGYFRDDFSEPRLASRWEWAPSDSRYSLTDDPGYLTIYTARDEETWDYSRSFGSPRLYTAAPSGDWTIETKIIADGADKSLVGPIAFRDHDNWVMLGPERYHGRLCVIGIRVINNRGARIFKHVPIRHNDLFLRMSFESHNSKCRMFFKHGEQDIWNEVGEQHIPFGDIKIGIMAKSWEYNKGYKTLFDYVAVSRRNE